jgi:hypothetical protein
MHPADEKAKGKISTSLANSSTASGLSNFVHDSLDTSQQTIRLLIPLEHGDHYTSWHIQHFSLDSTPEYRALSYTWGPPTPCHNIVIDGKKFLVRQNLFNFLHTYTGEGHLWVDQICIDQDSVRERNHQVSIMADIYRNATEVIVWLGDTDPALEKTLMPFFLGHEKTNEFYKTPKQGKFAKFLLIPIEDKIVKIKPAFLQFFSNPYWNRVWIVQEIMLARELTVQWGTHTISWGRFTDFTDSDYDQPDFFGPYPHLIPPRLFRRLRHILKYRNSTANPSGDQFASIAPVYCGGECDNPRDKVYGLMALTSESSRRQIVVDYDKSVEEVFLDAVRLIAEERAGYMWESTRVNTCFDLAESMLPNKVSSSVILKGKGDNSLEQLNARLDWLDYELEQYNELGITAGDYLVDKFKTKLFIHIVT